MNDPAELAALVADATGIPEHMRATPEPLRCLDAGAGHTCTGPVAYREALTATGTSFPRCDGAWAARLDYQRRVRHDYPDSPIPPAWFDPTAAGERWNEDD